MFKPRLSSLGLAVALMIADGLTMVLVARSFAPRPAPGWATGPFFWVLAWPVAVLNRMLPPAAAGGPSMLAVAIGAVIDVVLITALIEWLRRRRPALPSNRDHEPEFRRR